MYFLHFALLLFHCVWDLRKCSLAHQHAAASQLPGYVRGWGATHSYSIVCEDESGHMSDSDSSDDGELDHTALDGRIQRTASEKGGVLVLRRYGIDDPDSFDAVELAAALAARAPRRAGRSRRARAR